MTHFFNQYHSIRPYLHQRPRRRLGERAPAVARGARRASMACTSASCQRVLPTSCPSFPLVEPGQVRRPGRPVAGLSLHRRQPRRSHRRPPGQPGGSVPPVPLPHHHELCRRLSQGSQPDQAIGKIKELMVPVRSSVYWASRCFQGAGLRNCSGLVCVMRKRRTKNHQRHRPTFVTVERRIINTCT